MLITTKDLQGIIDLTVERNKGLLPVTPIVEQTESRRGKAFWNKNKITIPSWAWTYGETYLVYYTLHELTHFVGGRLRHGLLFKEMEDKLLSIWGLSIKRAKCYPKAVYANGQEQNSPGLKKRLAKNK